MALPNVQQDAKLDKENESQQDNLETHAIVQENDVVNTEVIDGDKVFSENGTIKGQQDSGKEENCQNSALLQDFRILPKYSRPFTVNCCIKIQFHCLEL